MSILIKTFSNPQLSLKLFLVVIILLTMFNNLEHSAAVYLDISTNPFHSQGYNIFQSYMVVIVFDLAIIAFIIKSKHTESVVFAVLLFVINCLFFNIFQSIYNIIYMACTIPSELHVQDQTMVKGLIGEINKLIAKVVFAALFSYSIHRFSYLWYDQKKDEDLKLTIANTEQVIQELNQDLQQVERRYEDLQQEYNALKTTLGHTIQELEQVKDQLKVAELDKMEMTAKLSRKKMNDNSVKI